MPCPYAFLLGIPKQGVHEPRVLGFARNDLIMTILLAIVTSWSMGGSFLFHLVFWLVAGEFLHWAYGTQTEVLTRLGIAACG